MVTDSISATLLSQLIWPEQMIGYWTGKEIRGGEGCLDSGIVYHDAEQLYCPDQFIYGEINEHTTWTWSGTVSPTKVDIAIINSITISDHTEINEVTFNY